MLTGRYLVLIEDDALMGNSILQRLELEGANITWVKQAVRGVAAVRTPRRPVDAVICDIRLPDGTGEEVFNAVSRSIAPPPFLFITGQGEIDQAVRLLRAGGADYMTKPFDMPAFLGRLALILRPDPSVGLPPQTGISPLARQVDALVAEFALHDRPVLIRGQRGLGKARIARRIHDLSDRRAAPFVTVNAFREGGAGDELGTALERVGDGTLFVNGVGRLGSRDQDRMMDALGDASFRLIASCGTRIDEKAEAGGFRTDALYALVANEIVVPPLSQRTEDAAWLAGQMFQSLNARRPAPMRGISELAMTAIRDHDWPGNGRELRSRLLRAMDVAAGEWIFPTDIFPELNEEDREVRSLSEVRAMAERRQIMKALDRTGGQVAEAARLLKVSRTTLWEKMQKLGL
ncbi:sigma-54-dependent Fis family transcriptional regulator [Limibaculum sp. M0105]|uniref:Sigma-54-dependent Fis family transcriptional regulator n=1 Tax=Thermohalobaculum xanthum TaxID=2753746 RepID=A0A8J7SF48_9RHOB|nr:response regulator [Thermohalobaculum xanthum]MBK0399916.1 sigma-54-dependent Fis family transcriptional regulator [Thermohalobaculum xanthum]